MLFLPLRAPDSETATIILVKSHSQNMTQVSSKRIALLRTSNGAIPQFLQYKVERLARLSKKFADADADWRRSLNKSSPNLNVTLCQSRSQTRLTRAIQSRGSSTSHSFVMSAPRKSSSVLRLRRCTVANPSTIFVAQQIEQQRFAEVEALARGLKRQKSTSQGFVQWDIKDETFLRRYQAGLRRRMPGVRPCSR